MKWHTTGLYRAHRRDTAQSYLPGVALAGCIGVGAWLVQAVETRMFGHAVIEALVIALVAGIVWRHVVGVGSDAVPGIKFTGKQVLELAVVLMGASINVPALVQAGPVLFGAVVAVVVLGIGSSFAFGRLVGLNPRLAILVAVGNSICGNSAIAAVAPVIDAEPDDIASSVALTAVLGVLVILLLPLLIPLMHLSFYQYGVLAGMTVYAVPQVVAATFPVSAVSGEIGTMVKLVRVLMLGPVVLFFCLHRYNTVGSSQVNLSRVIPWFIIGFVALAVARSAGVIPADAADAFRELSRWLTIGAMAALGLDVDLRSVRRVGPAVALTVVLSLLALLIVSVTLIHGLGIGL